ncbi:MAG: asparaginase [Thermoleophilia bacterium]|nr:asparaginase [Thermoleophilia bacterium]
MRPLAVEVRRGGVVEARHRVHAAAVRKGRLVAARGDAGLVTFLRSAAKPFQALPLARGRPDLDERELAIASASHLADDDQLAAVRSLLAKAPADEEELECGPEGGSRLRHNCSGKHAGMLALARANGWPVPGYRLAGHPVQQALLAEMAAAAEVAADTIATAVDGCGVITFAVSLERVARAFARLETLDGGARVAASMRAYPELIRGAAAADTQLMRALPGWVAKGGAEGVIGAAGPGGLGVALKVEDGAGRAIRPALAAFLAGLGTPVPALAVQPLVNSRGETVGEIATAQ